MGDDREAMRGKLRQLLGEIHEKYSGGPKVVADLLLSALDCPDGRWAIWQSAAAMRVEYPAGTMMLAFAAAEANAWDRFKVHEDELRYSLKPRPAPVAPPEMPPNERSGF